MPISEGLHYIDQGSGLPLIFQHGLTANSEQISTLLGELAHVRLVSMDCPGHGLSVLSESYTPSFDRYVDDLIGLLDRLGIDKGMFGGLSMGAGIALNAALRYPDRVSAIVLLRPAWLNAAYPHNLNLLIKALPFMQVSDGQEKFEKLISFEDLLKDEPAAAQSLLGIFGTHQQDTLSETIDCMVGDKPFSNMLKLGIINVPCLILGNDHDPLHPIDLAQVVHEAMKMSVFHKVAGRYLDPERHRTEVLHHISNFINQLKEDINEE